VRGQSARSRVVGTTPSVMKGGKVSPTRSPRHRRRHPRAERRDSTKGRLGQEEAEEEEEASEARSGGESLQGKQLYRGKRPSTLLKSD
jgi:hypothetical protein